MKKLILGCLLAFALTATGFAGDKEKAEMKWLTFDSASTIAAKSQKKVLVDVYTDWCGWCKRMDRDTYSDSQVQKYLGEKYVIAKLNPETEGTVTFKGKKISNADFSQQLGIRGYPTLVFLGPDGEVITVLSSYLKADQFLDVAKFLGEDKYKTMKWEEYMASQKKKAD